MKWPFHKGKQIQRPTGNYRCTVELDIRLMFYEPCTKKDRQQAPEAKMEAWNTPSPETLTKEATMPWLPCAHYLECSLLISLSVYSDPSAESNPLSADREPWHSPIPRIKCLQPYLIRPRILGTAHSKSQEFTAIIIITNWWWLLGFSFVPVIKGKWREGLGLPLQEKSLSYFLCTVLSPNYTHHFPSMSFDHWLW